MYGIETMDTSITLDAAKWNSDGAELSSCVITLFYWIMYYNIRNTFGTNLPVDFYPFVLLLFTRHILHVVELSQRSAMRARITVVEKK